MALRITILDLETDTEEVTNLEDDYLLICHGSYYLAHTNAFFTTGTHVLTIKKDRPSDLDSESSSPIIPSPPQPLPASTD